LTPKAVIQQQNEERAMQIIVRNIVLCMASCLLTLLFGVQDSVTVEKTADKNVVSISLRLNLPEGRKCFVSAFFLRLVVAFIPLNVDVHH
jgi:hypothetical protein